MINNNKENQKDNNNNSKKNDDKNVKEILINHIPLIQTFMNDDPNFVRKCLMMSKDPKTRALMEEIPWFKKVTENNPDIFKKMEDPNFVVEIPSNEEFNDILNKLKDENESK